MQAEGDGELLERARAGDRQALEALLDRQQARIYRFGKALCRDPEDAREVLQETLLAIARGLPSFRGASSLSTWVYALTRSFCIKKRRRRAAAPPRSIEGDAAEEVARLASDAQLPDQALDERRLGRALEDAIAGLGPTSREVLLLRDVEGLPAADVAAVLGIGVPAVKSRLHRARLEVRERLAPWVGSPAPSAVPATCPDAAQLFSRHLEGEIGPEECARMEAHLEACEACRGACDTLRRTLSLCRTSAATVDVPPAVQLSVRRALRDFVGSA